MVSDAVLIALIASVPPTVVALAGLIQSRRNKVETRIVSAQVSAVAAVADETKQLVDGPLGHAYAFIAELLAEKAARSGSSEDLAAAVKARQQSDAHTANTDRVMASSDAATAATVAQTAAFEERKLRR